MGREPAGEFQTVKSNPAGYVLVLAGLVGAIYFSSKLTTRPKLVETQFETVEGIYLGCNFLSKVQTISVLDSLGEVTTIELDQTFRAWKLPKVGTGIRVTYNTSVSDRPRVVNEDDVRPGAGGYVFKLNKPEPYAPWIVTQGEAINGMVRYPTDLPEGRYKALRGIIVGGYTNAVL